MNLLMVICSLSTLTEIHSSTVTSPQIRILDVATKASETRLIPHHIEYRNAFHPYFQDQTHAGPWKSYVIYDQYPVKIFKEWKANPPADFPPAVPQNFLGVNRNGEFSSDFYFQNGQQALPPPKPTLAYRSVYSNVIKVFDNSLDDVERNRFPSERYLKPLEGNAWKSPIDYEPIYPQDFPKRQPFHNIPENFPKVFSPNDKFHFPSFDEGVPPYPPKFFHPQRGFYDTHTINFEKDNTRHRDEVEVLPDVQQKNQKRAFLCGFIRVNQRQFPDSGGPCGRSDDDDIPLVPPEYPDYSSLPNDKIPVEHRRQHFQIKRIKRSGLNRTYENRQKRNAAFGYSSWGSPFGYESGYDSYFGDSYSNRNYGNSGYGNNRNRNQNYRNRYYSGSRYDEYDDDYQNNDESSRGLTGYLTNGGRRYKNKNRNNNDEDEDNDDDNNNNNENNRDNESDEEMERMNSNRRDTNDRRNNDDRDRRRNNNNNNNNNNYDDEDDYRDNRRNNNNRNNNRRYNNNNRRYNNNDRYNNNRNRYYSSSGGNGYGNNNGYGSNYGGYGSNYGGYGSNYGGGYGSGGYGSSYGGNGGYGYGGYGNGFGSF